MRIRIRIGPSTGENVTHYKSWVAAIIYLTVIKSFSLLLIRPRGRKLMSKNIILIICPMIGMISPTSSSTSIACFISIWILGYDRHAHKIAIFSWPSCWALPFATVPKKKVGSLFRRVHKLTQIIMQIFSRAQINAARRRKTSLFWTFEYFNAP